MKKACWLILCFVLLWPSLATSAEPYWSPTHFAVVMPALIAKSFEDSPEAYEGVKFPLFCGFASVYPKSNRFIFTKTTSLPITWVEKKMRQMEKEAMVHTYGHYPISASVKDENFFYIFMRWAEQNWLKLVYVESGHTIPLNMPPLFKRTCPYNSRKDPPVDCGYHPNDLDALRVRYAWEVEAEKWLQQKLKAN